MSVKPSRQTLHAQLLPKKSKGARRHNRRVIAEARATWRNNHKSALMPQKPKKPRKERKTQSAPVLMQMYASAVWQQEKPGQCPVCTGKASTGATVRLLDKGTNEEVRLCTNKHCRHYFREYVAPAAPVAPPKPVAAKPSLPEVDDVFMLAVWPTHGCATCTSRSYKSVQVHDKYDALTKDCWQCDGCGGFYKPRSW